MPQPRPACKSYLNNTIFNRTCQLSRGWACSLRAPPAYPYLSRNGYLLPFGLVWIRFHFPQVNFFGRGLGDTVSWPIHKPYSLCTTAGCVFSTSSIQSSGPLSYPDLYFLPRPRRSQALWPLAISNDGLDLPTAKGRCGKLMIQMPPVSRTLRRKGF